MERTNPMLQLKTMLEQITPALSFHEGLDMEVWRQALDCKLRELLGMQRFRLTDPQFRLESQTAKDGYTRIRFVIATEEMYDMPCWLLLPNGVANPPLMVCLQGHSNGAHISIGEPRFEGDEETIAGGRDFGIQAIRLGYAALCLEQRYFGERRANPDVPGTECYIPSMAEIMLGRSALGGRVWDISRALDAVQAHFPQVDMRCVSIMGNSGGGTVSWYAAALENRIGAVMPSCSICNYADSIAVIEHCHDQHIPGVFDWFEMSDLAGLIAPRPLVVVAGKTDYIFPLDGVKRAFERIQQIYTAAGAPDRCRLVVGGEGHRFYPDEAWPVFQKMLFE